jgi:hypothetical protein
MWASLRSSSSPPKPRNRHADETAEGPATVEDLVREATVTRDATSAPPPQQAWFETQEGAAEKHTPAAVEASRPGTSTKPSSVAL